MIEKEIDIMGLPAGPVAALGGDGSVWQHDLGAAAGDDVHGPSLSGCLSPHGGWVLL